MIEERESDIPEWEDVPEEKIPEGLQKQWEDKEKHGLRAGVCPKCNWPFTEEDLSCRHCGESTQVSSGIMSDLSHWFTKTPWGVVTILIITLAFLSIVL